MSTHRLPLSGLQVVVQEPTGVEELLLQEARDLDIGLAFQLFDRLVQVSEGTGANWGELPVTDVEALLLLLRRQVLGDRVCAEVECDAAGCHSRVDVSFHIQDYLASQKPRTPRGVEKIEDERPFRLAGTDVRFRLPNGADLDAVDRHAISEGELIQRWIRPLDIPRSLRRRVERAMRALAPRFSRTMTGTCPECHATMNFYFEVLPFVLHELRDHAGGIFEDVHLLAMYYKWPEKTILALPRGRRLRYGAALRCQGNAA